MKTPCQAIIATAELLAGLPLPKESQDLVQIIQHSSNRLLRVLNDLLLFSGEVVLAKKPTELRPAFKEVRAMSCGVSGTIVMSAKYALLCGEEPLRLCLVLVSTICGSGSTQLVFFFFFWWGGGGAPKIVMDRGVGVSQKRQELNLCRPALSTRGSLFC